MRPWDVAERSVVEDRMTTMFRRASLENFTMDEGRLMGALLARIIPQDEGIDLVGFMDRYADDSLGRGDKRAGMPQGAELIRIGLRGLAETCSSRGIAFEDSPPDVQDEIIAEMQQGALRGGAWDQVPSDQFFLRFTSKALHGYYSHPLVWMRIGFPGAAYPEGYSWVGLAQVRARHDRKPGWDVL